MYWTVKRLTQELKIPKTSLLRIISENRKSIDKYIRVGKRNRFEISEPGKIILEQMAQFMPENELTGPTEPNCTRTTNQTESEIKDNIQNPNEDDKIKRLNQTEPRPNQENVFVKMLKDEIKEKNHLIKTLIENQEKERERAAQDRERTDTIIMKMTNDLEQVRHENRLLLEESKKKEEPPKPEPKKTDRVISIQEFIAAKIDEDIERSNYEAEKKRLKKMYEDPLRGKSALYKIYVKMFRPDMQRKSG